MLRWKKIWITVNNTDEPMLCKFLILWPFLMLHTANLASLNNLTRQIVCYTKPSGKLALETIRKKAGVFKKNNRPGDWINHLSTTGGDFNQSYNVAKLLLKPVRRRLEPSFPFGVVQTNRY